MVVGAGTESIFIKLNLITKGFVRGISNANASMQKLNKSLSTQAHGFSGLSQKQKITMANTDMNRIAQQGFFKTMKMGQPEFKKFNEQGRRFTTFGGRMANSFRKSTHGMRGFRMEMLGVMFFGMMLQKAFSGLIKTSLDWMGVMEVFQITLGILFLPVAGLLLEWALKFLEWVSKLTPAQKKLIGTFVLFGIAIGGLLYIVGSLTLGLGSLILAFKFLFSPIGAILGILLALAGVQVYGMFDDLTNEVDSAGQKIATFGITGETLTAVGKKIWEVVEKVISTIVENLPVILEKGKEILTKIVDGISDNIDMITGVMDQLFDAISTWVSDNVDKLVNIGVSIVGSIIKGIGKGVLKLGESLGEIHAEVSAKLGMPPPPIALLREVLNFQKGGIMPHTGLAMLHAGERVTPANKVGAGKGVILNVTYNIEVSDKEEFERLLRNNNLELVEEVKRLHAI